MSRHGSLFALAMASFLATPLAAQTIDGRVLEASSGRPVRTAVVGLVSGNIVVATAESDDNGWFRLAVPGAGWYGLRIDALGYARANTDTLSVADGEMVQVEVRLRVTAVPLTPIIVDRRASTAARSELDRRIERGRQMGLGYFIGREALDSVSSRNVTGVLMRVPRMTLAVDSLNKAWPVTQAQSDCRPTMYLNGNKMVFLAGQSIDDILQPSELEAIEVYRSHTELPREFAGIDQCAAIVFWTRFGEPTQGGAWRFAVAGGALLGMVIFLVIRGALGDSGR